MNKGDFVGGIQVRQIGTTQPMILGGTADRWVCTWTQNGTAQSKVFQPEQLERVPATSSP